MKVRTLDNDLRIDLQMDYDQKSTVEEIRQRFNADVDRFSNLETGQSATVDAPLILDLVSEAAAAICPTATSMLDIGCGAGNYTLKLLGKLPGLDVTLIDLSRPMLDRASERLAAAGTASSVQTIQGDIREIALGAGRFDVIVAAMVLHHLRGHNEWESVFAKLHSALRSGGAFFIADHVEHGDSRLQSMFHNRWGEYLTALKDSSYRDHVFAYTDKEDTPRPLMYQIDALRRAGFSSVDVLHKNVLFAAWVAIK